MMQRYSRLLLILVLLAPAGVLLAQDFDPPAEGLVINALSFEPEPRNVNLEDLLEFEVGDRYRASALADSIKNIMRLGIFSNVTVVWSPVGRGLALTFQLETVPRIEGATIRGYEPLSLRRVVSAIRLDTDDLFDETRPQRMIQTISNLYQQEGFYDARAEVLSVVNLETGDVRLEIVIMPGELGTLGEVNIVGYPILTKDEIITAFDLQAGDRFREEDVRRRVENIQKLYSDLGYLTADVTLENIVYNDESQTVDLILDINAGPRILTTFEPQVGNESRWLTMIPFTDRNVPVEEIFKSGATRILESLRGDGYTEAQVDITYSVVSGGALDMVVMMDKGEVVSVRNVTIEGIDAELAQSFLPNLSLVKQGWFSHTRFSKKAMEIDAQRIQALLNEQGYFQATVQAGETLDPVSADTVNVLFQIEPGPQATIISMAFIGNQEYSTSQLLDSLDVSVGDAIRSGVLENAVGQLRTWYDENGYTRASVRVRTRGGEGKYEAIFDIEEGPQSFIQNVIIAGNLITRDSVIRSVLTFKKGDAYSYQQVAESQRALNRLGIFDRVEVLAVEDDATSTDKRIVVQVEESKPYSLLYGIGMDSEEKFRFSFGFSNANITGRNIESGFSARVSGLEQRYQLYFRSPRIFGGLLDNSLRAFYEEFQRPGYGVRVKGIVAESSGFSLFGWSLIGQFQYRWIDAFDVEPGKEINRLEQPMRIGLVALILNRDSRNDLVDPTAGSIMHSSLQFAHRFVASELDYVRSDLLLSNYRQIFPYLTLATNLRVGVARTLSESGLIPISERFFLGGSNSLRGFNLDSVGPTYLGADGLFYPLGGNAMINANAELRFPLLASIGGVVFYGLGNVYESYSEIDFNYLEHAAGFGLRFGTPFGPLRLDYGISLTSSDNQFYFTVGHAY